MKDFTQKEKDDNYCANLRNFRKRRLNRIYTLARTLVPSGVELQVIYSAKNPKGSITFGGECFGSNVQALATCTEGLNYLKKWREVLPALLQAPDSTKDFNPQADHPEVDQSDADHLPADNTEVDDAGTSMLSENGSSVLEEAMSSTDTAPEPEPTQKRTQDEEEAMTALADQASSKGKKLKTYARTKSQPAGE